MPPRWGDDTGGGLPAAWRRKKTNWRKPTWSRTDSSIMETNCHGQKLGWMIGANRKLRWPDANGLGERVPRNPVDEDFGHGWIFPVGAGMARAQRPLR